MELVTMGNLLVLGLSLAAIFALRYLDRQNRSVDLAREYGRRLKEEIAAFGEQKAAEVRDNGLVLDVQKSAVKEALNRLGEAQKELDSRTEALSRRVEEVGRIGDRIGAYDKSMEELIRTTGHVEENMKRLRDESVFVEETARKIGGVKTIAENLERDVGSLELRFERENAAALEKAVEGLVSRVEGSVEDLKSAAETVERQVEEHRQAVDRIEAERRAHLERDVEIINKTLAEAVERAAGKSDKLEEAALVKLREDSMVRLHRFQGTVEEKFQEYHENARARVAEIQGMVKSCRDEWKGEHEGMEARQKSLREELEAKQRELYGQVEAKYRELREQVRAEQEEYLRVWRRDHEELEAKQREYRQNWQRDLDALDALALSQRTQWEAAAAETGERIAALGKNLDAKTAEAEGRILAETEKRLEEYREGEAVQWRRLESLSGDALKLDGQLRLAMEAAEERIRREAALFEEDQSRERESAAAAHREQAGVLQAKMAALEQELNELKNRAYDNVSEKLKGFEDDFFAGLARRENDIEGRLNEWQAGLERRLASLGEEAEAERRGLELSFREDMTARIGEQGGRIMADLERLTIKADAAEEKIRSGLDETENRLSQLAAASGEISRELKEFTAQTGLFEKTGELKASLERSMEALRGDLSAVEERRAEAARLETEFVKIRRLEDEVNAKMTRFLTEKNHLDIMERDFEKLLQTSARVEERLKEVFNADDTLQNVQVSIRKLEDAMTAAEDKYQRMENKNRVLEETNQSIERNFQMLEETELALRKCRENIGRTEDEMDTLRPSIAELAAASEKAREAGERLETLDGNLKAIEDRIEKMQVAREWLARAETGFEKLNREAQEELKLLEAVLKEDRSQNQSGEGAPPPGQRENVVKLRRKGWEPEEIARTLKLSRSEVELILGL
ncbi:MAG: hypothetical protein LBD09_01770 [Treponema sp.]|jgi:conjugal transfer/entry exclusion protein|nr:hypothetical protein [Treponema sp.]